MAPYEAIAPAIAVVVTVLILCIFFPRSVYILVLATVAIPIPILALFIYVLWYNLPTVIVVDESSAPIQIDLAPTVAQQDITAAQGQTSSVIRKSKKKSKPSVKNSTSSDAHADADRKYPEIITIKTTTESQGGKLLFAYPTSFPGVFFPGKVD
ncbi:hypothetical protein BV25DRAFT_1839612 [Artomyces pyxidatus]|uniref:Uncharacterized protein n=1 Tax=Artomyces pyxidatus TaxID=48021 RepID=A0ACB8SVT4_9AGAM|nr:hypothetical protein BV25DRAFT_1839612 [Artomyces pyxidatus]